MKVKDLVFTNIPRYGESGRDFVKIELDKYSLYFAIKYAQSLAQKVPQIFDKEVATWEFYEEFSPETGELAGSGIQDSTIIITVKE